jgi:lysophospholipase L1-like esterase
MSAITTKGSVLTLAIILAACSGEASLEPSPPTAGAGGVNQSLAGSSGMSGGSASGATGVGASAALAGTTGVAGSGVSTGGDASVAGGSGAGGLAGSSGSGGGAAQEPTIGECAANQLARCSGSSPIQCDFGGSVGDYLVTLDLGGDAAGKTYVEVESYRRILGTVDTAAGSSSRFSFVANVRDPEGQPVQDVPRGTPGLQVYLRGGAPKLSAICAAPITAVPKVWIAGDSTVCDQSSTEYAGWGQHLPQHFRAPVSVANYADSGESSGTVLNSAAMWGAIKAGWKSGDWVLVQVGHNDKTVTTATFQANIKAYVTQAKAAGVNIILCTPISRVGYSLADEHQSSGGANIPQIIRDVAKSENVPLIDLTTLTWNWLQTIDWKQYFALGTDRTHTNPAGAEVVAGFVRDAIREQKLGLAPYIR